ncbi:MAG: hypothetical protein L3J97_00510 [Thermoplasmata archaeon]|nr:hypothetical protein [Thermoplasmata archaeon]
MGSSHSPEAARLRARHQLRQVLSVLALLDSGVLVLVIGLVLAWERFGWPTPEFLTFLLFGVGGILLARVALAVRLQRRSGNLF